ncbi:putative endopolygalacturonase 3 [Phaeomoniella chlamydospora]|uniref:endo-polygalacturonase n=1 Tax=Phaeomoniella chlamydospora TaxID=158046 RepID=A0A0G2HEX3_PHACM|nr:putative endopolygalacturonase 3 [Phaeomoniella chlamydospora]
MKVAASVALPLWLLSLPISNAAAVSNDLTAIRKRDCGSHTSANATSAVSVAAASETVGTSATVSIDASCTVTEYSALAAATESCTALMIKDLTMPADTTLDLSELNDGTTVVFSGTTTFEYAEDDYDMIKVGGTDIEVYGETDAVIDGNGSSWWDGEGSNGGKTNVGLSLYSIVLNNTAGDEPNSDSDDCVAVTSGSNITVSNFYCSGGHGLSIGSVGGKSDNTVSDITFTDSTIVNSENGCRIKSNYDTTGSITNIVYSNIVVSEISDYGIDIQQDYENGGATGTPSDGVTIQGVTMTNITGTATSDAVNYYILCGTDSCSDFTFNDISITGGSDDSCNVTPSGDFSCD